MPTSSIFASIKITDRHKAELFVNELEAASSEPRMRYTEPDIPTITDREEIRKLMLKWVPEEVLNQT